MITTRQTPRFLRLCRAASKLSVVTQHVGTTLSTQPSFTAPAATPHTAYSGPQNQNTYYGPQCHAPPLSPPASPPTFPGPISSNTYPALYSKIGLGFGTHSAPSTSPYLATNSEVYSQQNAGPPSSARQYAVPTNQYPFPGFPAPIAPRATPGALSKTAIWDWVRPNDWMDGQGVWKIGKGLSGVVWHVYSQYLSADIQVRDPTTNKVFFSTDGRINGVGLRRQSHG
jgi:hypothetical protein